MAWRHGRDRGPTASGSMRFTRVQPKPDPKKARQEAAPRSESEKLLEQERREAQARVADLERRLQEAEDRAAASERKSKEEGPRPRAARKLAEAQHASEEAQRAAADASADAVRIRDERDRLDDALRAAVERDQATREAHERERGELQARVAELEAQVQALQLRVDEAEEEHAREHALRRQLEEWLGIHLAALDEAQAEAQRQTGAAVAQSERLTELEAELERAREEAARERAAAQRVEQRLDLLVESETDARKAREQHLSALEQAHAEALRRAETAERALAAAKDERERVSRPSLDRSDTTAGEPGIADTPTVDVPAVEPKGDGSPPTAPRETHASGSGRGGRRLAQRWRRRPRLPCAVCHRARPAMSNAELTADGWDLTAAGALCPSCRQGGWHFPTGATVPFRRVGARSSG
jgi:hypothetical protein